MRFDRIGLLLPVRDAVNAAVERRHAQVRELWSAMLEGIGMRCDQSDREPASSRTS